MITLCKAGVNDFTNKARLLFRMVERDLRSRYVGSLIGIFWTALHPLLLLLIFTFIFAVVFQAKFSGQTSVSYSALYILCGLIPWLGFQEGVARSVGYLVEQRNLLTRVKFPVAVLPPVPVLSGFFAQMVGFFALLLWAGIKGRLGGWSLVLLPFWMILQLGLGLGLAYLLAVLGVWLRDLIQLVPVLLLVWMYGTPVFYPARMVPEKFQIIIWLNPMAHLIEGYRRLILEASFPAFYPSIYLLLFTILAFGFGWWVFHKLKKTLADRV